MRYALAFGDGDHTVAVTGYNWVTMEDAKMAAEDALYGLSPQDCVFSPEAERILGGVDYYDTGHPITEAYVENDRLDIYAEAYLTRGKEWE